MFASEFDHYVACPGESSVAVVAPEVRMLVLFPTLLGTRTPLPIGRSSVFNGI